MKSLLQRKLASRKCNPPLKCHVIQHLRQVTAQPCGATFRFIPELEVARAAVNRSMVSVARENDEILLKIQYFLRCKAAKDQSVGISNTAARRSCDGCRTTTHCDKITRYRSCGGTR